MEDPKEKKNSPWLSVPQFGDWDQKGGSIDYSIDFTKIREMRKLHKRDASRVSLGNEEELINPFHKQSSSVDITKPNKKLTRVDSDNNIHKEYPSTRRGIFSCFKLIR